MIVVLLVSNPVQATDLTVSYSDRPGDLSRFILVPQGLIQSWTPLGEALSNVDILESSLTLKETDGTEVYIFGMTTAGDLPTVQNPQEIDRSSIVLLFWFWTIQFSTGDDFNLWNSYDVMLIWDCSACSYSAFVWDYTPCIATEYQPDRVQVGIPEFVVSGSSLEMVLPVSWLPEGNRYEFCWMFITAARFGENGLEDINNLGYYTGGTDMWVDKTDAEAVLIDPYPTSIFPFLPWPTP